MNPGKLKKILLFLLLAILSALLWYGNSRWRVCDRSEPLEPSDIAEQVDTFPADRTVCLGIAHPRMLLLGGLRWKIRLHTGEVVFNGTLDDLSCKRIALPVPGDGGNYRLSVQGMDVRGKILYTWQSDKPHDLRETGVNDIRLLHTGEENAPVTLEVTYR